MEELNTNTLENDEGVTNELVSLAEQVEASPLVKIADALKNGLLVSWEVDRKNFYENYSDNAIFGSFYRLGRLYEFHANLYQISLYVDVSELGGKTIPIYSVPYPGPNGDILPLEGPRLEDAVRGIRKKILALEDLIREAKEEKKDPSIEDIYSKVEPRARNLTNDQVSEERERLINSYRPRSVVTDTVEHSRDHESVEISEDSFGHLLSKIFAGVSGKPGTDILRSERSIHFEGTIPFEYEGKIFVMEFASLNPKVVDPHGSGIRMYSNLNIILREQGKKPFIVQGISFQSSIPPDPEPIINKLKASMEAYSSKER